MRESRPSLALRRVTASVIDSLPILLLAGALRISDPVGILVVAAIYHAAFRLRTPGRRLMGIAVVRMDSESLSPGTTRALIRTFAYALSALPLGLGFFWALRAPYRTWHDKVTGTIVTGSPAGMPLSRLRIIGATVGLLFLAVLGGASDKSSESAAPFETLPVTALTPFSLLNGKLAMSAYMLTGSDKDEETWRTALRRMKAMGVQVVEIGQIAWHEIETEPGRYRWGYAETILRLNREENLGIEFVTDFMFLNPGLDGVSRLPKHLEGRAFDDPEVIESLSRMYEAYLALAGAEANRYLFQHFENAAAVVAARPDDVGRLQRLLRESFARAKRARPDLRTGVCVQRYQHPHWPASEVERWNAAVGTDVVPFISFGPAHFEPGGDVSRTRAEFEALVQAAGGRPVALHETGHSSGVDAYSSDAIQSAFVRELFALLRERHDRIEFATWYEYADLEPIVAMALGGYLSAIAGNPLLMGFFTANMGTCGLVTADGEAKPAARVWVEEAERYYERRRLP